MMTFVLVFLYVVLPSIYFILFLSGLYIYSPLSVVNYFFSLFSFYVVINNILISLKIPVFQLRLPHDKMIKVHVFTGLFVIIGIYFHFFFKLLTGSSIDLLSWVLLVLFSIMYVIAILWIETPLFRKFRKKILNRIQHPTLRAYDTIKKHHGYVFFLFGLLVTFHVNMTMVANAGTPLIFIFSLGYPIIVFLLFAYSKIRKSWLPELELIEKRRVSDIQILTFKKPEKKELHYHSGQFAYIRFLHSPLSAEEHPFSFLSCPSDPYISFGIKVLGDFTERVTTIEPKKMARINGGFGNFIPRYDIEQTCFIGSGVGIVPIVSLIRDMKNHPPKQQVLCFLSVNTREELLYEKEMREIADSIPQLRLLFYIYQEDGIRYSETLFESEIPEPQIYSYYICSSPTVRTVVVQSLKRLGVPKKQLHYEVFSY